MAGEWWENLLGSVTAGVSDILGDVGSDNWSLASVLQPVLGVAGSALSATSKARQQLKGGSMPQVPQLFLGDEFGGGTAAPAALPFGGLMGGATGTFNGRSSRSMVPFGGGGIPPGYRIAQRNGQAYLKKIRHMNPLNPRALLRAERRMGAFTHWVKRHFRIAAATPRRKKATRRAACYTRRRKR